MVAKRRWCWEGTVTVMVIRRQAYTYDLCATLAMVTRWSLLRRNATGEVTRHCNCSTMFSYTRSWCWKTLSFWHAKPGR